MASTIALVYSLQWPQWPCMWMSAVFIMSGPHCKKGADLMNTVLIHVHGHNGHSGNGYNIHCIYALYIQYITMWVLMAVLCGLCLSGPLKILGIALLTFFSLYSPPPQHDLHKSFQMELCSLLKIRPGSQFSHTLSSQHKCHGSHFFLVPCGPWKKELETIERN